jgi:AcrR family transcriptional regulator
LGVTDESGAGARSEPAPTNRSDRREALLVAAERLLIEVGYGGITTRVLARRAGVNQGLVHYYFGTIDEVLLQVLERFTARLIERQRAMYEADVPFVEKWRTAMGYVDEDMASGYQKVWLELQALAWNRPEISERVARVDDEWRDVLAEAFGHAMREFGIDRRRYPTEAIVALVGTFNLGMIVERHVGCTRGHQALLRMIDRWLDDLEAERVEREGA